MDNGTNHRQQLMDDLVAKSEALRHQIAGRHASKESYALLDCNDGTLLKPVQRPPKGQREVDFYEMMSSVKAESNPLLFRLKQFLPVYYGNVKTKQSESADSYLHLENVVDKFHKPCIMDVKIGRISYDPLASPEKVHCERSKYPPLDVVGFAIIGMKIYTDYEKAPVFYDVKYGRSLSEEDVLMGGLGKFFGWPESPRRRVVRAVLERLKAIQAWFYEQTELSFYASSLLIIYEYPDCTRTGSVITNHVLPRSLTPNENDQALAVLPSSRNNKSGEDVVTSHVVDAQVDILSSDVSNNHTADDALDVSSSTMSNDQTGESGDADVDVVVKMIDFTHVFPTSTMDSNYVYGLDSLIGRLERLLVTP